MYERGAFPEQEPVVVEVAAGDKKYVNQYLPDAAAEVVRRLIERAIRRGGCEPDFDTLEMRGKFNPGKMTVAVTGYVKYKQRGYTREEMFEQFIDAIKSLDEQAMIEADADPLG